MNCKLLLVALLLICFGFSGYAQSNSYPFPRTQPYIRPRPAMPDSVVRQIDRRASNFYFFSTIRKISEPSTISFPFLSLTHNVTGTQKKPFVLDADIQTPIAIGGKRFSIGNWMYTIHVIPRFKVRIFQDDPSVGDESIPVRTPSTIPGVAYYGALRKWWDDKEEKRGYSFENIFVGLYAFHHSNGQDGPELDTINIGQVNTYNGNFGEQVAFEFILGGKTSSDDIPKINSNRNAKKEADNSPGKQMFLKVYQRSELYWKVSYELHPRKASNQVFDSLSIYGRHRLNLNVGLSLMPRLWEFIGDGKTWWDVSNEANYERWRFTLNANYIMDGDYASGNTLNPEQVKQFDLSRRLNLWLTAYWVIGFSQHAALFTQVGYYGSDNYNIYFNQSLWNFKLGIAFGFFDQQELPDKR
ncbi:MAG TPA: hypothetical protein VFU05_20715 [Cyclobacteriaceae bacterium]|nr:hypothetical protein [Cyclobacteriaceae bacterium]